MRKKEFVLCVNKTAIDGFNSSEFVYTVVDYNWSNDLSQFQLFKVLRSFLGQSESIQSILSTNKISISMELIPGIIIKCYYKHSSIDSRITISWSSRGTQS